MKDDVATMRWLTSLGDAAIAVLRLEGVRCGEILREHLRSVANPERGQALPRGGRLVVRAFVDREGAPIDEVVVRSLGDEGAAFEVCVHGGIETARRMAAALAAAGVVVATAPRSAPSLLEAEAERAFLAARTELAARFFCAERTEGSATAIRAWLARPPELEAAQRELSVWAGRAVSACALLVPRRVVLVGAVNAGKSSLFNALANDPRAIVSPLAGTTRDPMRTDLALEGYPVEVWDTAGFLGSSRGSALDDAAWALTEDLVRRADLVVELIDLAAPPGGRPPLPAAAARLTVGTKTDLGRRTGAACDHRCSAATGEGLPELRQLLARALALVPARALLPPAPFLPRHVGCLERALGARSAGALRSALLDWLAPSPEA